MGENGLSLIQMGLNQTSCLLISSYRQETPGGAHGGTADMDDVGLFIALRHRPHDQA